MFKGVKVSRPRKRILTKDMKVIGFPEPVRKTMYDILVENFKTAQRNTFLHRIIYIGEHDFPKFSCAMGDYFEDTISNANQTLYISETITGILIQYVRHFIHMIEGDEDCIILHLKLLFQKEKELNHLSNMKLLLQICHVNDRLSTDWSFYHATPPKLLEKIESDSPLEETTWQICKCIEKIYKLIYKMTSPHLPSLSESGTDIFSAFKIGSFMPESSLLFSRSSIEDTPANNLDNYRKQLPETERLDYILNSQYPLDVKKYLSILMVIPQRHLEKDEVWPVPADFIPYDILYSTQYNIKTELPVHSKVNIVAADEDELFMGEEIESELSGNTP